ncbi:ubl carboxyl-terminal hydrolase 18 isoform X1 [Labrus mixtus]|uniref:ubl carboxyl-terminal hydrolase 18 isoform X1 n=2 Tax=Labrus mixtus TaxID=508554 RepID=UPI0029C0B387|nr:ubl carboxyl-terminal hydrolase 18 isoform X1 [Labrus mixtus]
MLFIDRVLEYLAMMSSWSYSRFNPRTVYFSMRGLRNEHLSCCVNTLLQTLSATWELSDLLDKWESSGVQADVPLQLKRVLSAMRGTVPHHAPHLAFLHSLDRNCIRLCVQHDADEVFLSILNLIQKQMDDRALALQIQNLYRISVEEHLQCLECNSDQTQTSFMLSLPLHLKDDHDSLESCMASFFEHQELGGRDCCYCNKCETKTPSKKGVKLLSLPRILRVNLKRFRNYAGTIRKLEGRVTFPETFDLSEVLKEAFSSDFTQNDCRYALYAVVVHSGYVMSGHYTAYVRLNQQWYYADDSCVNQVSWEEVKTSYGGRYRQTAYMLMYRRCSEAERPQQAEFSG